MNCTKDTWRVEGGKTERSSARNRPERGLCVEGKKGLKGVKVSVRRLSTIMQKLLKGFVW